MKEEETLKGQENTPYNKETLQELLVAKDKQSKLEEHRWRDTNVIHERKVSLEVHKLLSDQELKIMLCNVNTLESDVRKYMLTIRSNIVVAKVVALNDGSAGTSGSFRAHFSGGSGGYEGDFSGGYGGNLSSILFYELFVMFS